MREYELTAVYDLAVAEQGGADAAVKLLTTVIEARGGKIAKIDHWGRRRLAYPIGRAIDGDYIISRVELDPSAVSPLEETLRIDERVYRHLVVRADELPAPPQPREPRRPPGTAPQAEVAPAAPVVDGPVAEAPVLDAPAEAGPPAPEALAVDAPVAEAPAEEAPAAPEPPAEPTA